ncbi:MAG: zinc ribbon domain-containing protein [archaeon]|nr:zinc ribbon domain-containing protein [archaeon]
MAKTKTRIFPCPESNTMDGMIKTAEKTLKELGMSVETQILDKTLVEISGKGEPGSLLKKNLITLFHEPDESQIFVKFKAEMKKPDKFWELFENNIEIFNTPTEGIEKRAKIVSKIVKKIAEKGYSMVEDEAWEFLGQFEESYKRLPEDQKEIESIASSYTVIMEEEGIIPELKENSMDINQEDEFKITPTDALKEIIKEIETLTREDRKFFINLFSDLDLDEQKKLVTRIKAIESDLDKIPYLDMDSRAKLRKEIMNLSTDKRRAKILKIINKRKKNINKFEHKAMETELRNTLNELEFLTELEKEIYFGRMEQMNLDKKKDYIKRIKNVELSLNEIEKMDVKFSDVERRTYRDEFLRISEEERERRISEIIEDKKYETIRNELIDNIPALKFEDHEKLIKELLVLSSNERKKRINKMKSNFDEGIKKKNKAFEESKAGSTCPECGWPIGALSKKCPRCGEQFGFSL